MRDNRKPGQSQLDYLWTTFGEFAVTTQNQKIDNKYYLPTLELVKELLLEVSKDSANLITLKGNYLILYSNSGKELSRIDISELQKNSSSIVAFGSKQITQEDIDQGCTLTLNSKAYYITLSDGNTFWASQEILEGFRTKTISTEIIDNKIVSQIVLDPTQGNVQLLTDNGLKAILPINNLNVPIQFTYVTEESYQNLDYPEKGVVYFIANRDYLYFNGNKIGSSPDLFVIVDKLPDVGIPNKIYIVPSNDSYSLYVYINGTPILVGGAVDNSELIDRIDKIENTITWNNI